MTFGLRRAKMFGLIVRAISFQDFSTCVVLIHQRHRQTDRRHAIARHALHYSASRGKNCPRSKIENRGQTGRTLTFDPNLNPNRNPNLQ